MPSRLMKSALVVACLTLVSFPLSAQKGKPGGGGGSSDSCVNLATPSLSTQTASPGLNVGVFGKIGNCSSGKKRFTVSVSSVSSCSVETVVGSSVITFAAGETKLISVSYPLAPNTCLGPMTVTVGVSESGKMLASQSTTLMVQ